MPHTPTDAPALREEPHYEFANETTCLQVALGGATTICVNGHCIVKSPEQWHALAARQSGAAGAQERVMWSHRFMNVPDITDAAYRALGETERMAYWRSTETQADMAAALLDEDGPRNLSQSEQEEGLQYAAQVLDIIARKAPVGKKGSALRPIDIDAASKMAAIALPYVHAALAAPSKADVPASNLTLINAFDSMLATQQPSQAAGAISGALFDFLGFLTTSEKRWTFSAYDDASPAVHALEEWAAKRGLSLADADVENWRSRPPAPPEGARVAAGWKLVPVEPTDEMVAAAMHQSDVEFYGNKTVADEVRSDYRAMLAASPETAEAGGWISVDDRMPELDELVWLHLDTGQIIVGARCDCGEDGWLWGNTYGHQYIHDGVWKSATMEIDDDYKVTRWYRLPSPPPADEETGK